MADEGKGTRKLIITDKLTPRPGLKEVSSIILPPREGGRMARHRRIAPPDYLPKWDDHKKQPEQKELDFRQAREGEADYLKWLYEDAWNNSGTKARPITIAADQIRACIRNFPEGQIVGFEKGGDGTPVSMINIMLGAFDPKTGFPGGYEALTGGRTFSTSVPYPELMERMERSGGELLPIAYCVSIAVPKQYGKSGYAFRTLKYAASVFAEVGNGLIPCPYSAPRDFARAKARNKELGILDYLHMTKPMPRPGDMSPEDAFWDYFGRIGAISDRLVHAFGAEKAILSKDLFMRYQAMPADSPENPGMETAFALFRRIDSQVYEWKYGRPLTIEDFCIMTGRTLWDGTIGMHVANGARFIRDEKGGIIAVFPGSRPEDPTTYEGYNIVLSYCYHQSFGHKSLPFR